MNQKLGPNYGTNIAAATNSIVTAKGTPVGTSAVQINPHGLVCREDSLKNTQTQLSIISIELEPDDKNLDRKSSTSGGDDSSTGSADQEIRDPADGQNRSWWRTLTGLGLAVLAATCLALSSVMVKQLNGVLSPAELGVYRFAAIILFTLPVLGNNFTSLRAVLGPKNLACLLLIRSLACGSALIFKYYSYQNVPLGDGTAIALATPTLVSVLAWVFLKEPFGWCHIASLLITASGVGITSRIDLLFGGSDSDDEANSYRSQSTYLWGLGAALVSTLLGSCNFVLVRRLKSLHSSVILFNLGMIATMETTLFTFLPVPGVGGGGFKAFSTDSLLEESSPLAALAAADPDGQVLMNSMLTIPWYIVAISILSYYSQFFMTRALQLEEAGLVTVTRAGSEVIFSFVCQMIFFSQQPDFYSLGGCALTLTSVLLITARKSVMSLPQDHRVARYLRILTK